MIIKLKDEDELTQLNETDVDFCFHNLVMQIGQVIKVMH